MINVQNLRRNPKKWPPTGAGGPGDVEVTIGPVDQTGYSRAAVLGNGIDFVMTYRTFLHQVLPGTDIPARRSLQ